MELLKQFDLGYEGFLKANTETLEALSKAMTAGSGVDAASFTGGRALTPESLDTTLVNVLHSTDEARLFQRLKKNPVKSVVHQWNYRDEVGAQNEAGWVPEGGASAEYDQTIERKYTTSKYLQSKRVVTLQAMQSNMLEDAIAIEQNAGALWMIREIEKALFTANSAYVSYQPDGLKAQIPATNKIDLRGKDASSAEFENAMNEAARMIRDQFGVPTDLFVSTMVMQDVQALLRDRIRFGTGMQTGTGIFKDYPTPFGNISLIDDVFIREGAAPSASTLDGRPGTTQVLVMGAATSDVDATALFGAADAGDYCYKIEPINRYGAGAAVEKTIAGVAEGDGVQLAVTTYPVPAATAYRVYRSKVDDGGGGATVYYAFTVTHAQVVADGNKVIDRNFYLPGTSSGFVLNMNPAYNAIEWVQFLPLMKFDLYPTDSAVYPFLMLLFGSLAVKKPTHHVEIINVSPSNLGWF